MPNALDNLDINFGRVECKIVTVFMNRLYVCSNERNENCHSWDLNTGHQETHPPLNVEYNSYCYHQVVEVNGKIMITGGIGDGSRLTKTAFLTPNFNWEEGPTMSKERAYHAAVAMDDTNVVLLGGSTGYTKLYNDDTKSDTSLKYQSLGFYISACKISDFDELGNDMILVHLSNGNMFAYNWQSNSWQELSYSWKAPTEMTRNVLLFNTNGRLYLLGGSIYSTGGKYSSHVFERKNHKWVKGCNMESAGVAHYIGPLQVLEPTNGIVMNSNQKLVMNDTCIRIKSPDYFYNINVAFNVTLPEANCSWKVLLRFLDGFNLNCNNTIVNFTSFDGKDESHIGSYCGENTSILDSFHINPGQTFQVKFKSQSAFAEEGFAMKMCKEEDCCFHGVNPTYWEEWGEWSRPKLCPYDELFIDNNIIKRSRICRSQCECKGEDVNIETENQQSSNKGG